ncbi:MAG: hypothetical protein HOP29_01820 [Phycisphaerales bacterium]|nr:hypothetical protein [Phycisphaerales bacterium]
MTDLDKLLERREIWRNCLSDNTDPLSIANQLHGLVWNLASWRVINEARRFVDVDPDGEPRICDLLHSLLDECFVQSFAAGIRRLVDLPKSKIKIDSRKGVCSISSLLDDMAKHAPLLTRRHLLDIARMQFDEECKDSPERHRSVSTGRAGIKDYRRQRVLQRTNRQINELCGVSEEDCTSDLCISRVCFERIQNDIKKQCQTIKDYATKYVAHAAHKRKRPNYRLNWGLMRDSLRSLCKAFGFMQSYIVPCGLGGIFPSPLFDPLKHLDCPLVSSDHLPVLRSHLKQLQEETRDWLNWRLEQS